MKDLQLVFGHPACDIYFNPEMHAVQTIWKYPLRGIEFRKILDNIIDALNVHKAHLIIADARNLISISKDDQDWIIHDWYPRAVQAGFAVEALIVKKDSFNEYVLQKIVHHYDDEKVKTIYFHSYADAEEWLLANLKAEIGY
jgi:hypothetical protein